MLTSKKNEFVVFKIINIFRNNNLFPSYKKQKLDII